jgi:MFS family permease
LFILYVANLLFMCAFSAYFLLPVYLADLGATKSLIGTIMSSMGVSNTITLIWIYFWGAERDTRRLMLLGCMATTLSCAGMVMTPHLFWITAIRLLQGFAFCLYFVSLNTYVTEIYPPSEHAKQIGLLGIITLATQSAAPAAAEAFVAATSFQALFWLTVALAAGSAVAVLLLPASKKRQPRELKDDFYGAPPPSWLVYGFQISAVALLGGAAYGTVLIFSPLYLKENGIWPLSLFFTTYAAAAIFARFVGRNWADRYGRIRVACTCFIVLAGATLCLGRSAHAMPFAAASALFGVGHGLMYPAVAAHSIQIIPGNLRAMTIWAGGFIIGISAGAACAGAVAEYSDIGTAIQLAALLPLTAFVLLCFQSRKLFLENR